MLIALQLALKHYTSKLSSYSDISSLRTFGFRGEALSSLCAVSDFRITTAQASQAPKASRLELEPSGKLKSVTVVAGQKGTTASVENLFRRLPVRRRELEKNAKREYGKLVTLLQAYACISTDVRFSVKSQMAKGKNVVVFATHGNATTRENISNIYGAKTVSALVPLALELAYKPSFPARRYNGQSDDASNEIVVRGHISKPVFGEGRQTPDRQMLFVNNRPCGLPQIAKAFNEVYKSFNVSQSPFIFANFEMDTGAYDVNVSPDKRTILLHDAGALIESLKEKLAALFENIEQTVPQSQPLGRQQSLMKSISASQPTRTSSLGVEINTQAVTSDIDPQDNNEDDPNPSTAISRRFGKFRESPQSSSAHETPNVSQGPAATDLNAENLNVSPAVAKDFSPHSPGQESVPSSPPIPSLSQSPTRHPPGPVQSAFDRMRPTRPPPEMAEITVGGQTVQSRLDRFTSKRKPDHLSASDQQQRPKRQASLSMMQKMIRNSLSNFQAPGSQLEWLNERERHRSGQEDDEEIEDVQENDSMHEDDDGDDGAAMDEDNESAHDDEIESEHQSSDNGIESLHIQSDNLSGDGTDLKGGESKTEERRRNDAKTAAFLRAADLNMSLQYEEQTSRAERGFNRQAPKDSTLGLVCTINASLDNVKAEMEALQRAMRRHRHRPQANSTYSMDEDHLNENEEQAENRLSLTVTKDDFSKMSVVGQFNLGFILAVRLGQLKKNGSWGKDELFIIDQHASDEKFNFERLQAETVVQNQRLVQPKRLDLTAVEEETIIDNKPLLEKNGFVVDVDLSGDEPIGNRCKLVSLPLSKEVVFGLQDLEELLVLLSETPATQQIPSNDSTLSNYIPRPSKVRNMFAMRACRSSIMIGRPLSQKQMETVIQHMGAIDKPWNCPHGRPTMRHLITLNNWATWNEYARKPPLCLEDEEDVELVDVCGPTIWSKYIDSLQQELSEEEASGDES